jgi:hypothetical protein
MRNEKLGVGWGCYKDVLRTFMVTKAASDEFA